MSDWKWPLDKEKLEEEMARRSIKLYSYYLDGYRRKIVWRPFEKRLEVHCENVVTTYTIDQMEQALEKYNEQRK